MPVTLTIADMPVTLSTADILHITDMPVTLTIADMPVTLSSCADILTFSIFTSLNNGTGY